MKGNKKSIKKILSKQNERIKEVTEQVTLLRASIATLILLMVILTTHIIKKHKSEKCD